MFWSFARLSKNIHEAESHAFETAPCQPRRHSAIRGGGRFWKWSDLFMNPSSSHWPCLIIVPPHQQAPKGDGQRRKRPWQPATEHEQTAKKSAPPVLEPPATCARTQVARRRPPALRAIRSIDPRGAAPRKGCRSMRTPPPTQKGPRGPEHPNAPEAPRSRREARGPHNARPHGREAGSSLALRPMGRRAPQGRFRFSESDWSSFSPSCSSSEYGSARRSRPST